MWRDFAEVSSHLSSEQLPFWESGMVLARNTPNVLEDAVSRRFWRFGFLSHLRSMNGYDNPETLASQIGRFGLTGADVGQGSGLVFC